MIYGFIIAAGNQTRFDSEEPKALSRIGDLTCLDINIHNLGSLCDCVYIVCSTDNESYFKDYTRIVVDSGFGCGDAVMKALKEFKFEVDDTCFIQWGDSISDYRLYKKVKKNFDFYRGLYDVIIPCEWDNNPYVRISKPVDSLFVKVEFSKYGEVKEAGLHDLSIFYGRPSSIKFGCDVFCSDHLNLKDGYTHYNHKHGDEFNFLDMFNEEDITSTVYFTYNRYNSYSFNTVEEYKEIEKEIGDIKWI